MDTLERHEKKSEIVDQLVTDMAVLRAKLALIAALMGALGAIAFETIAKKF